MPQVSGEGQSVTLNNTIKAPFTKFDIEGHSEQESTSIAGGDEYDSPSPDHEQPIKSAGENVNLFDKDNVTNAYLNADGTTTSNSTFRVSDYIDVSKFDNITISGNYGGSELNCFYDENKTFVSNFGIGTLTVNTKSVPSNAKYIRVTLRRDVLKQYKLEPGSTATPYSPYGMGSISETIGNRNLAKHINGYITSSGVFRTDNDDSFYFPVVKGNTYIYDCIGNRTTSAIFESIPQNYSTPIEGTHENYLRKNTPFVAKETGYMVIFAQTPTSEETINSFIANKGSTVLEYVPHEEQDYSIFVQQPMRSIGDVRDCFVKKSDGKLYERHYIRYLELLISAMNNSEEYPGWTNVQQIKNDFPNVNSRLITKTSFLCNIFEKSSRNIVINTLGNNSILYLDKSLLNLTQTQWKENYPNLVLKLVYISPEPLDLPCTETQIQQLENKPSTYKDFTIIQSQDETPAYLEVAGIYDLNNLINN